MVVVETIKRYLREHRRLVVPSFGTFIVKQPGTVLFSELISADDGVLRQLLTEQGLSEIEAAAKIDRLIFEVRHSLINEGRCRISGFGHFTRATDGNIRFYADHNAFAPKVEPPLTTTKSSGKSQAAARPVQQRVSKESGQSEPHPQQKAKREVRKQSSFGGFAIWFAIIVIVAALAAIAYGIYCEMTIPDDIDATMDAKRVEIIKESPNK